MTQTIGIRSRAAFGSVPRRALFLSIILAAQATLWSQTYQNIGVEVGPARPTGFIDAFKDQGRLFLNLAQNGNAPTDASGNPTTDGIAVVFDNRPFPAWNPPIDDPANDQPNASGTYTIAFTGTATLGSVSGYPQLTFSNQTYHATADDIAPANTTTVNVYMPGGATFANGPAVMVISFTNTQLNGPSDPNVGDGIANLQAIRPGFTLAQAANPTQVFDPAFVSALAPFGYLRFMNWLGTNTNPYYGTSTSPVMNWADRSLPNDSFQGLGVSLRHGAWGISWEYVILLANAANKDVWINIPINATGSSDPLDPTYVASPDTSSYVYNLAYLLKNGNAFTGNKGLNPGLHIYLEHSNEVWNSGFLQYAWNQGAAQAEGCNAGSPLCNDGDNNVSDWQTRRHLKRLYEISQIFQSVFGAGSLNTTIRPVYTWFQFDEGAGSGAANALAWFNKTYGPPSHYLYAMAQGDYFTNGNWANDTTIDQVLQDMQSGSQASVSWAQQNLATAQQYGLPLFVYEGGPGTYNGGTNSTTNIGVQIQANRQFAATDDINIGMDLLVKNHIANNWFAIGGSNFGYFQFSSGYSRYGAWGATDDYCNLSTAKYSALINLTGYSGSVPAPPQNVTATTTSQNVILTWPAVTGAANYTVQRGSASSGPFTTLGTACTPGYTDLNVTNGTTYYYVISAVNGAGQSSSPSSPVSATPSGSQQSQTINFTPPPSPVTYPVSPITLSATASSGLPVTFGVVSGPGTVSGSTLTITGTGTIVIAANQPGNANYSPAAQVTQSVVVNSGGGGGGGGGGTLLAYEPFGEASGTPLNGATGSGDSGWEGAWVEQSGSTVTPGYEILSTSPLTYGGLRTTGNYAIGGYQYQSAGRQLNVTAGGPFNSYLSNGLIGAAGQTIWFSFLLREDASPTNGQINALFLNNDGSGNSWMPQVGLGVGYFGGTADWGLQYKNGTPILSTVPVVQGQPALLVLSVTFGATNQVNLYVNPTSLGESAPATPSATLSTTDSVAFQSISYLGGYGPNESSLADIRVGSTYAAVTPTSLPAQTITFTPPASPVTYPVSPIKLSATASSGLLVTFSIVSGPGTVSGSTLTVTGTGTIVIAANQSGDANYAPAAQVTQIVVVNSGGGGGGGGTLLAYEPFGEASGTPLNGATGSGDSGWEGAWIEQSGSTVTPGYEILSASPLTYSGLQTTGNYAIGGYQYQSAGRQLNVSAGGPFNSYLSNGLIGTAGQTIWLSFLLREDASPTNGQINALFLNNYGNGNSWVPQVGIGVGYFGGTAQWGLQLNNGTPVLSGVPIVQGQTNLLVLSVTFGATNQVNLFVNPTSLGGSAPVTPSATFSTTSNVAFQSISYLGGYGTNISSLADIRIGATYAAVTP